VAIAQTHTTSAPSHSAFHAYIQTCVHTSTKHHTHTEEAKRLAAEEARKAAEEARKREVAATISPTTRGAEALRQEPPGQSGATPLDSQRSAAGLTMTPKRVNMLPANCVAVWDFEGSEEDELSFKEWDVLTLLRPSDDQGWMIAELKGKRGMVPCTHLEDRIVPLAASARSQSKELSQGSAGDIVVDGEGAGMTLPANFVSATLRTVSVSSFVSTSQGGVTAFCMHSGPC
jgi:hypothetical protein